MPIEIREGPEPSFRNLDAAVSPLLIESDVSRLLLHEARRYRDGTIPGRSFLIAGHRGSGKTTLVAAVLQKLAADTLRHDRNARRRPLPIMLHGPNLLPDQTASNDDAGPSRANPSSAGKGGDAEPEFGPTREALIQITLGMYRALAEEFIGCFRERITGPGTVAGRRARDLLELGAQLETELDEGPEAMRLREFWRRGGFLDQGVLFAPRGAEAGKRPAEEDETVPDQGLRELIALASACDVYRRISGSFTDKETLKLEADAKRSIELSTETKGKDLFSPITSLLTGGLVGAGTLAAGTGGLTATVSGIIAALGASTVFKQSSSRRRDLSRTRESVYERDRTLATLDREVPKLIDRIRDAGLTPIFVVEELDKVKGLSLRITDLVRRLKQLVAERAFFCFLTDRNYFEEMRKRSEEIAYPIEYTYFTHQLFVVFRPEDLHEFLGRVLVVDVEEDTEAQADRSILPYVLLRRAEMHPIDLKRATSALRDPTGSLSLPGGVLRSRLVHRIDLTIQVAAEIVLADEDFDGMMEREPAFRRLAHDAMYYPTRERDRGETELVLGDGAAAPFEAYLLRRMKTSKEALYRRAAAPPAGAAEADEHAAPDLDRTELAVREIDRDFLLERVRDLVELLDNPIWFCKRLASWEPPADVMSTIVFQALALLDPSGPLLSRRAPSTYHWLFDRSGRQLDVERATRQRASLTLKVATAIVEQQQLAAIARRSRSFESRLHRRLIDEIFLSWQEQREVVIGPELEGLLSESGGDFYGTLLPEMFRELARLLADAERLNQELSLLRQSYIFLPPELDSKTPLPALLERVSDERYRWRVDDEGRLPEEPAGEGAVEEEAAAGAGPAGAAEPEWQEHVRKIRGFAAEIERLDE